MGLGARHGRHGADASLVRDDVLRELAYSARVLRGEEAVQLGLATRVCADPLAEARAMAQALALRSPSALRAAKRLANRLTACWTAMRRLCCRPVVEQQALIGAPHQVEAVRGKLGKRAPDFGH